MEEERKCEEHFQIKTLEFDVSGMNFYKQLITTYL